MFSMQDAGGDSTDVGSSCSSLCLSCLTLFMAAVKEFPESSKILLTILDYLGLIVQSK